MTERLVPDGSPDEQIWERGWQEHEVHQRERLAKLSLPEKLLWLEQAHRLVRHGQTGSDSIQDPGAPKA